MTDRQLVLHIGAPKCGSSALQTALSRQPVLAGAGGQTFRYVVPGGGVGQPPLIEGAYLRHLAATSVFGYVTFPAVPAPGAQASYAAALDAARQRGLKGGFVPVLSNEGWIGQAAFFAATLAAMGHPPVEAVAFLRAPVDWLNASYWQWGVWSQPQFAPWYGTTPGPYALAENLAAWAAIPNLRLQVFSGRTDVAAAFAGHLGVALESGQQANRASPPALIGFLLRNRRFRPDAHAPQTEFVWQRWCPAPAAARRPWAVRAPDVQALRPLAVQTRDTLQRLLPPLQRARLFATDPRWQGERPYHAEILLGPTPLHRLDDLAPLYDSLAAGIAAAAAGTAPPTLPAMPPPGADHAVWDGVLSAGLDVLLRLDETVRQRI